MTSEIAPQLCAWDAGCVRAATRHVNWILRGNQDDDKRREKHLCDAHTSELRDRPGVTDITQDRSLRSCSGVNCQILFDYYLSKQNER